MTLTKIILLSFFRLKKKPISGKDLARDKKLKSEIQILAFFSGQHRGCFFFKLSSGLLKKSEKHRNLLTLKIRNLNNNECWIGTKLFKTNPSEHTICTTITGIQIQRNIFLDKNPHSTVVVLALALQPLKSYQDLSCQSNPFC